jgi:hypothetical protein
MQNQEITKFEFLLTLEKNIVIQRYFNVIDYNPASKNSIDLYECVKFICSGIQAELTSKTLDYLSSHPDIFPIPEKKGDVVMDKEENFLLQIKLGEDVFISRIFPAHVYHPKARYAVDIRPKVRKILLELSDVLSSKVLTKTYLQYELK